MVEYFNKKANLSGNVPLGSFNAAFSFTGLKHMDSATTKSLYMDAFFISLAKVQLVNSPLVLQENVKRAVPSCWDPPSLARYGFSSYMKRDIHDFRLIPNFCLFFL